MALYQVFLQSLNIPYRQFGALNNISFEYKKEDGQVFYRKKLVKDLIFGQKDDYEEIFALTPFENEEVTVTIKVDCDGVFVEKWKGTFTIMDCKVDVDNCEIQVKPKVLDRYSKILAKLEDKIDLWDYFDTSGSYKVKLSDPSLLYTEVKQFTIPDQVYNQPPAYIQISGRIIWWWEDTKYWSSVQNPIDNKYTITAYYHHLVGFGTFTDPPDITWNWEPWKDTTEPLEPPFPPGKTWRWVKEPNKNSKGLADLEYGQRFITCVKYGLTHVGAYINDVKSNFFGYNADGTNPNNLAYLYSTNHAKNLTLHQKSDVKRPYDKPADKSVWTCKLKDLLDDLRVLFNVYWDIDDDDNILLEHITFFKSYDTIDVSNAKGLIKKYDYSKNEIQKELFFYSDEQCSLPFAGYPIIYLTNQGEIIENRARLFSLDVYYIQDSVNAENIQDKGFVICTNTSDSRSTFLKKSNEALSWKFLHEYLHRNNRPYQEFYLNGFIDSALSKIKTKQQDEFFLFICCDSIKDTSGVSHEFDPKKLYTTSLGDGEIESAIHDLTKDTLTLKLNY